MSGTLINLVHIAKTQNRNLGRGRGVVEKTAKDKAADGGIAQIVSQHQLVKKSGALIVAVLGKNGHI